jgi:hypothetical protein
MPTELRDMLHDAVSAPPHEASDPRALLESGHRRVTRRRRTVATLAAVVVLALAGSAALLPRLGRGSPGPVGPVQPVGRVVHPADAVDAVRGRDYRVLYRHDSGNLDRANGLSIGPVAEDGSVLVQDGPHGIHNRSRYGVLDPTTGRTRWLPDPPDAGDNGLGLVGFDRDHLVLADDAMDGRHLGLWVLARSTVSWRRMTVDVADAGLSFDTLAARALADGRVYLSGTGDGGPATRERGHLWSVALTPGATLRDEKVDVGTFAIQDGVLTYMAYDNRPTSELHVRDLATGEDRTYDTQSGRHCNQLGMVRVGDDIALWQYCGTHRRVRDDRVQVVTATGAPVVTVQGDDLELDQATDRFLSVVDDLGPDAGTYVYDLRRGRLLRVSHGRSHFAGTGNGHGSRLIWSTPILHGHGRTQWVADFR